MTTNKSTIIKKLTDNYPSFYKRDLNSLVEIFLSEVKNSLKRHERVELRDIFTLEPKFQKERYARNPKTNEKIYVKARHSIFFKASKNWSKIINEKK